jgi:hypothetical protein
MINMKRKHLQPRESEKVMKRRAKKKKRMRHYHFLLKGYD